MEQENSKNILVTGGAGFIGSHFVERLSKEGITSIVLDSLSYAGHRENLGHVPEKNYELVVGKIQDPKLVASLFNQHNFSAVVNFAAESHVDRSIDGPAPFIQTNIQGCFNLLNEAKFFWDKLQGSKKKDFRFIQVSTDEVFGSLDYDDEKFSEKTPYQPNSPYSASKAAGDHLARAWFHTYDFPTIITNCSNNYGPRQFPEKLIPNMIHCALKNNPLPVYARGENIRDWIHVSEHCEGIFLALTQGKPGSSYCFGGNSEVKNIDLVKEICRVLDDLSPKKDGSKHESAIKFVSDRPGHDLRYAIDDSFACKELAYSHKINFSEGLRKTVEWYLNNQEWTRAVLK